jgi:hypothetical protein
METIEKILINEKIKYRWINKNRSDKMMQLNRSSLSYWLKTVIKKQKCNYTLIDNTFLIHD